MKVISENKWVAYLLIIAFCVSSCSDPDSVTVVEDEEPIETSLTLDVNDVVTQREVVAAYCQTDSSEFIILSNKPIHLGFPVHSDNFEEGDFVYLTHISHVSDSWGHGTQLFGEEVTGGMDGAVFISDGIVDITSNNGNLVAGSSSGVLVGMDNQGEVIELPYTIDFVSEILHESDFCTQ